MIDEVEDPKLKHFKELELEFKSIELEEQNRSDQSRFRPLVDAVVNSIDVCNVTLELWVLSQHVSLESRSKADVVRLRPLSEEFRSLLLEWDLSRKSLIQTLPKPKHFQGERNELSARAALGHIPDEKGKWRSLEQGKQLLQTASQIESVVNKLVQQLGDGKNNGSTADFDRAFRVTLERLQKHIVAAAVGWESLKRLGSEAMSIDGAEMSAWVSSLVGLERLLEKAKVAQGENPGLGMAELGDLLENKPGVDLKSRTIRAHLSRWAAEGKLLPFKRKPGPRGSKKK